MNIWVGNVGFATSKNIKDAVIKFKVSNSWLNENGFKAGEIKMLRWDGSQWLELETDEKSKYPEFTHFEAHTNAFSLYAIAALKEPATAAAPAFQAHICR